MSGGKEGGGREGQRERINEGQLQTGRARMKLETNLLTASLTFITEQTRRKQETLPTLKQPLGNAAGRLKTLGPALGVVPTPKCYVTGLQFIRVLW